MTDHRDDDVIKLDDLKHRNDLPDEAFDDAVKEKRFATLNIPYDDIVPLFTGSRFMGKLHIAASAQRPLPTTLLPGSYQFMTGKGIMGEWCGVQLLIVSPLLDPVEPGSQPPPANVEILAADGALLIPRSEDGEVDDKGVTHLPRREGDRWQVRSNQLGGIDLGVMLTTNTFVLPLDKHGALQLMRDIVAVLG